MDGAGAGGRVDLDQREPGVCAEGGAEGEAVTRHFAVWIPLVYGRPRVGGKGEEADHYGGVYLAAECDLSARYLRRQRAMGRTGPHALVLLLSRPDARVDLLYGQKGI